jgi:acetyl coenzyme A synthetase (ADP forming)-like protein
MAHSLDALFLPQSVAVIGASRSRESIGGQILTNLITTGFCGPVFPVNPSARQVQSIPAYASLDVVPGDVDLAVVAVPRAHVMDVIEECGRKRVRCVIVISAGYAEMGAAGVEAQAALRDRVRALGMRMVGPNCLGALNTDDAVRLDATFARSWPPRGHVSFCSQSGALGLAVLDYARSLGIGVRHFVSVGNKADVSTNDLIEYWEQDDGTRVILLYVESFGNPRKFLEIARRVTRKKPIVALKSGRSAAGARAASSHTGALAGADASASALLEQAGVVRVSTLEELFGAARLLATQPVPRGSRVGILTNAGGPAIIATDALEARGLDVPPLDDATTAKLRSMLVPEASVHNPVDMVAGATAAEYEAALPILLASPSVDAVVPMLVPTARAEPVDVAAAFLRARAAAGDKPIAPCIVGSYDERVRAMLADAGLPAYTFPEDAAASLAAAARYARLRAREPGKVPDFGIARPPPLVGPRWLSPGEAFGLLEAYDVAVAEWDVATSADAAVRAAVEMGFPVALKIVSDAVMHKTDVGGVKLGLADEQAVRAAYGEIAAHPEARGVLVQRMAPRGVELFVGMTRDPAFGPLVAFGIGGTGVELWGDVVFRVAPLTTTDAGEMLDEIRGKKLLDGFRGAPAADRAAVADVLLRVSRLALDVPEVAELDVNPLIALPPGRGVLAVDTRARIA